MEDMFNLFIHVSEGKNINLFVYFIITYMFMHNVMSTVDTYRIIKEYYNSLIINNISMAVRHSFNRWLLLVNISSWWETVLDITCALYYWSKLQYTSGDKGFPTMCYGDKIKCVIFTH